MVDYTEAAQRYADNNTAYFIDDIKQRSYLSEEDKAQKIEDAKKSNEYDVQLNKAIAKELSKEGPDFFNQSLESQEKKLFEALMKEGVLKEKQFDDGSGSQIVLPDGFHHYPPADSKYFLSERAGNIVGAEAFRQQETMKKDTLNPDGNFKAEEFRQEYNTQTTVSQMNRVAMQFIEKCAENPRAFTKDSLDLSVTTSQETKDKSIVSEEEFKGLLAERLKDQDKIKETANNLSQRYYGEGLMAQKDSTTQAITYSVDGQQLDKNSFQTLLNCHTFSEHQNNKLTEGVQYGSLICLYNPKSKDLLSDNYKEKRWMTSDGNGGLKEVSNEMASQIYAADKTANKDVSAKKLNVENYGGGLMHIKDQNGKSSYINANNIPSPHTGQSHNMFRSQIMSQAKQGGR